ncbi:MAG: ABC transporter permease [Thomasclavelia sp.]
MFKNLYQYRELLKTNVKKEIRGKYKGSFLGVLWSFINPLLQVLVYAIVFPYLMNASVDNYLVYLVTGIIPWNFFLVTVSQGTTTIKSNAGIIKKVYFPREILPISVVSSGLVNFFISCIIIMVFCILLNVGVSWHLVLLPIVALIETILILGIVLILSAINVYIQDIEYIISFVLNMLFYGTPIIYELSQFSSAGLLHKLVSINPVTQIINSYRDIFLYHVMPNLMNLFLVFILSIVVLVLGFVIFRKLEKGFAEEL